MPFPQPVGVTREPWIDRLPVALRADTILMAALHFWQAGRAGQRTPSCDLIDPLRIPRAVLPHVILVDCLNGRFRYRLVGTRMVEQWGEDFTGRHLDEITTGEYGAYIASLFGGAERARAPVFGASAFRWDVGRVVWTRRLMLPYGEPDAARIMCVQTFDDSWPTAEQFSAAHGFGPPQAPGQVLDLD